MEKECKDTDKNYHKRFPMAHCGIPKPIFETIAETEETPPSSENEEDAQFSADEGTTYLGEGGDENDAF